MHKRSGFTLIELLVVISIIAILATIGLLSYTNFMKNSRDSKRQSDLKMIQSALESYHADQIYYPYSDSVISGSSLTNATGGVLTTASKTYLTTVPSDPTGTASYSYKSYKSDKTDCPAASAGDCISYCLFAKIERIPPPSSDQGCTPTDGYTYGVTRP